jgi:uncharacterized membrane protein YoaK (UPF0700 family)/anti-anti-sigma regulatory factor
VLVAQAHSFAQQTRLAITLAWVAGYVNVVGIVVCGTAVSHVSGITSGLGKDVADGDWHLLSIACWLVAWFLCGAFVSGVVTDIARIRGWKSIYVLPIAAELVALSAFAVVLAAFDAPTVEGARTLQGAPLAAATALACLAMGIQNATITRISGGVVRTTHVTGVVTDLGLELAHALVRHEPRRQRATEVPSGAGTWRRIALLASILGSFAFGAGLGGAVLSRSLEAVMVPPVLFLAWIIWQDVSRPIADLEPEPLVAESAGLRLPSNVAFFRMRCRGNRRGGLHRLPNMQAWADALDPDADVVVLDLSEADDVELAGAEELRAVAERFHRSHRALVLSGVDIRRFESLRVAGLTQVMPLGSMADDAELALAYALERAEHFARRAKSEDVAPPVG